MFIIKIAFLVLAAIPTQCIFINSLEFKELKFLINLINGELPEAKKPAQDIVISTVGYTNYTFYDVAIDFNNRHCASYGYVKKMVPTVSEGKRTPIKVKCLQVKENNTMQVVSNLKEVVTLLAPNGNSTKRTEIGNCALVLFYTKSCPMSAQVAPLFNAVAKQFPTLRIGAIDANKFHGLNADFGIVAVPTVLLFHQGRPVVKFNDTRVSLRTFNDFVYRHTGINPTNVFSKEDLAGPLSYQVEVETDYCLYLAWSFILVCSCYYFTKSKLYSYIIEAIKRNWHESEAQHEHQQ